MQTQGVFSLQYFLIALCCSTTVAATVGSNRTCVMFQTDSHVCGMWSDRQEHIHTGHNDILQQVESHLTGCKGYCSAASANFFFFYWTPGINTHMHHLSACTTPGPLAALCNKQGFPFTSVTLCCSNQSREEKKMQMSCKWIWKAGEHREQL